MASWLTRLDDPLFTPSIAIEEYIASPIESKEFLDRADFRAQLLPILTLEDATFADKLKAAELAQASEEAPSIDGERIPLKERLAVLAFYREDACEVCATAGFASVAIDTMNRVALCDACLDARDAHSLRYEDDPDYIDREELPDDFYYNDGNE
jgi:hypothetical protein